MLLTLLVMAALYFILFYVSDPVRQAGLLPNWLGHAPKSTYLGWFGYNDQGCYLRLAHTLASFNFHQLHTTFTYGIGYPIVAVPAIWLGFDRDPFVFFNFFAFILAIYAVYKVSRYLISPFAGFLAGFGLLFATPLIAYVDIPWNSTVCLVVMSAILIMLTVKRIKKWQILALGFLVAWAFSARYVDVIFLGPLALASVYRGSLKQVLKYIPYMALTAAIIVIPVMCAQYKVFGSPFRTPYVTHLGIGGVNGSDQGFAAYNIGRVPRSAVALFIGPRLAGAQDADRGLLITFFWALAAIPGVVILLRKKDNRVFFVTLLCVGFVASIFYLSFRASTPGSLKYGELHYFKMFWPPLVLLAVAFFDHIFKLSLRGRKLSSKK
jgi:hypothetical protein